MSASRLVILIAALTMNGSWPILAMAQETPTAGTRPKRVLLIGQKPDTHPRTTHEYMAGNRNIARLLQDRKAIQVVVVQADNPWSDGPELLDTADGVVLYLTEGAKWVSADKERLAAFQRFAARGGGLTCLHWGMGTREAPPVASFVALFGGCHGGPDRKYKYGDFRVAPASTSHPIISGVSAFDAHDEFYYDLKFPASRTGLTMLLQIHLDDADRPVAWAWERPDQGRSFGFTGLHFHENWKRVEYRRFMVQGILWTLRETFPADGLAVDLADADLALPDEKTTK